MNAEDAEAIANRIADEIYERIVKPMAERVAVLSAEVAALRANHDLAAIVASERNNGS